MRRLSQILAIALIVNACSSASFKGITGGKSRDNSAPTNNTEDNTKGNPPAPSNDPVPIPQTPRDQEDPHVQNPAPCQMLILSLANLYQLHDDNCQQTDNGDSGKIPDDTDENNSGDDSDEPGQNNPGQN